MIRFIIKDARKDKRPDGTYYILHPSNDAILAYCDNEREADAVIEVLNGMCKQREGHDPALTAARACFTMPD